VPEVVDHGLTGFIVEDVYGAVAAVDRLGELSRREIRAQFERRFTSDIMAQNYVDLYAKMLKAQNRPVLRQVS
jgi:glycosyltransferase involved in cell wall biosynthesis